MSKRSKQEMIDYFLNMARAFSVQAHRLNSEFLRGKAEAYEMAAFELEHNMEDEEDDINDK